MKNEEYHPPLLYKIMSSKDLINQANTTFLNNANLNQISNKIKEKLHPLKKKIKKYSKKIDKNIKSILNTSDIMTRAKKNSFDLKDILIELDQDHKHNIAKFKKLRKINNENQSILSNFIKHEKEEEEKNEMLNDENKTKINSKNDSMKSEVNEEMNSQKMHKLLSDNILLMAKRREIFSYYLIKNKYQSFNDEKKIRYIDKIREMLEIKQIQANDLLDEKEKKVKLQNIKFYVNQEKRLKKEMMENNNKLMQKLKQENELSLRNIKETNATLRSIRFNKTYLDDEIKLKYEHIPPLSHNKINRKRKNIQKITEVYSNNKKENDKTNINMSGNEKMNKLNVYYYKLNKLKQYKGYTFRPNEKKSLINLKRFILSKSTFISRGKSKNIKNKSISLDSQIISNNYSSINFEDENLVKSRMNSVYEEIKHNNVLMKKDKDFMKGYFENKKMKLSKKPRQAVAIMSNSLSRINEIDVTKKLKRIHGMHIPEKYVRYFDKIESLSRGSNNMKCKIFDSLCKVRMDD